MLNKKFKIKDETLKKIITGGIILIGFRAFAGLFYKVGRWYYYSFGGRFRIIKNILLFFGILAIIIWVGIMYLGINYIF